MAIKISSIQFYDYRAFFDGANNKYLLNTEDKNLLIYGENGSGKTSMFRGVKDFFYSTTEQVDFIKHNRSVELNAGYIKIKFSDGSEETFSEDGQEIPTKDYVKSVVNLKSFLTYKELLKTYLHDDGDEDFNLFDLLINGLLKDHKLSSLGKLQEAWFKLNNYFLDKEKASVQELLETGEITKEQLDEEIGKIVEKDEILLKTFGDELQNLLDEINKKFVELLKYFEDNLSAELKCNKDQITGRDKLNYYKINCRVTFFNKEIDGYLSTLNEARLSALAITIYLSAILKNPTDTDYKILFLDDIFIGLDMSNRIPLLEIIKNEFKDYQIFITTYDKHWYELAQRYFNSEMPDRWKYVAMYVGKENNAPIKFEKPIIIQIEDSFSTAINYLHHPSKPDYPAAANYFRKYAEEILTEHLPNHETRNVIDDSLIESYRVGKLIETGLHFLKKINADTAHLLKLQQNLPPLLHPLSHYDLSSPVYKGELIEIEGILLKLNKQLTELKNQYKILIPSGRMLKLIFKISSTEKGFYEIFTKEAIYLLKDISGNLSISSGLCHCKCTYVLSNGAEISRHNFSNDDQRAKYFSIENAYDKIFSFISTQSQFNHIPRAALYTEEFEFSDNSVTKTLDKYLIW